MNASNANASGNYASVTEQTGIKAGDGGYQLDVKGITYLDGAVITSTQAAIDAGKNSLTAKDIVSSDIQNFDSYSAGGYSVGVTVSGTLGNQPAQDTKPGGSAGVGSGKLSCPHSSA